MGWREPGLPKSGASGADPVPAGAAFVCSILHPSNPMGELHESEENSKTSFKNTEDSKRHKTALVKSRVAYFSDTAACTVGSYATVSNSAFRDVLYWQLELPIVEY